MTTKLGLRAAVGKRLGAGGWRGRCCLAGILSNGSAVTTPDGVQTRLLPVQEVFVRPGSTVHFGDRTFHLGQA
jgi:hypothetical protein